MLDKPLTGKQKICDICFGVYSNESSLRVHRLRHFKPKFQCLQCDKFFYDNYTLNQHISFRHLNLRNFICDTCNYKAPTKSSLQLHIIQKHTKDFPHTCNICGKGYTKKDHLNTHYKSVHEGVHFVCEICAKVFKYQSGLQGHLKKHHSDSKPRLGGTCDICGKKFLHLNEHKKRLHSDVRRFVCDLCGKAFYSNFVLEAHKRVHRKEKPFKCTACDKGHTTKYLLKVHMMGHTGDKPYECDTCQKLFATAGRLKAHKCKALISRAK